MANEQFERRAKEVISSRNMANGVSPLYGMSMGSRGQSQMTAPQIISNCIPPNLLNMPVQVPRRSSFHQKTNSLHKKRTRPLSDYEIETYGGDVGSAPINFSPNQIYDARSSYRMQPETNAYGSVNVPLAQAQQFPGYVNRNMYTAV